jgi:two-component system OmpR family response regulator
MSQHILVVDDEVQIRELLSVYLRRQGYSVSVAANGAETMAALRQSAVDLVVLDIGLEHEDGLGLLGRIKTAHPKVRVIMLTGMGFVEDLLEEALQKGADDYVSKVLALDELHMAVQRVFKQKPPRESAA